jgi:hypothetical protein
LTLLRRVSREFLCSVIPPLRRLVANSTSRILRSERPETSTADLAASAQCGRRICVNCTGERARLRGVMTSSVANDAIPDSLLETLPCPKIR